MAVVAMRLDWSFEWAIGCLSMMTLISYLIRWGDATAPYLSRSARRECFPLTLTDLNRVSYHTMLQYSIRHVSRLLIAICVNLLACIGFMYIS
jgi:hypothetical protein